MSLRNRDYGIDVEITRKLDESYDQAADTEREVLAWILQLTDVHILPGKENVRRSLMNGQVLCQLIKTIYENTPQLPGKAAFVRRPITYSRVDSPFQNMENIEHFLCLTEAYGVQRVGLFQTVDLYEGRNMAQVLNTLIQLGTECQRHHFRGPVCGPRPTQKNRRHFSFDQLRSGEGVLSLQAGTNKFASQRGMSFGAQRHIADIRCDNMSPRGQNVISPQMGSNKFASQKGMQFGAVRQIADNKLEEASLEGLATLSLQMGTNKCASQKGMQFGASRNIADPRVERVCCPDSEGIISRQYGTNRLANQSGMSFGGQRQVSGARMSADRRHASLSEYPGLSNYGSSPVEHGYPDVQLRQAYPIYQASKPHSRHPPPDRRNFNSSYMASDFDNDYF